MISAGTTLGRLLDEHPELVEVLARYHPHFGRLRNRVLRKVMAPRVTVGEAARMAGVPAADLLRVLGEALGETVQADDARPVPAEPAPRPPALAGLGEARLVRLDVREDLRRGQEPLGRIMAAVKGLAPGQVLVVRAPFEPVPLYDVLGRRGLAHWTERQADDDWSVWFYRPDAAPSAPGAAEPAGVGAPPAAGAPPPAPRTVTIDVRGLEPPMPMVLVLERLERLEADEQLEVIHERRPLFLYPLVVERGFVHETDEPEPGVVRILIRRAAPQ